MEDTRRERTSNSIDHDRGNGRARGSDGKPRFQLNFPTIFLVREEGLSQVSRTPDSTVHPGSDSDGAFNAKRNHGGGRDKSELSSFRFLLGLVLRRNASIVFKSVAAHRRILRKRESQRKKERER